MNRKRRVWTARALVVETALTLVLMSVGSGRVFAQDSIGVVESVKGQWRDTVRPRLLKPSTQIYTNTVIENMSHKPEDQLRIRFDHFEDQGEKGTYSCADGTTCRQPICPDDLYRRHLEELRRNGLWQALKHIALAFSEQASPGFFQTLSPPTKGRLQQRPVMVLYSDGDAVKADALFDLWLEQGLKSDWGTRNAWHVEWAPLSSSGVVQLPYEPTKMPVLKAKEPVPTVLPPPPAGPGLYFLLLDFDDGEGGAVRSGYRMPVLVLPMEKKSTAEPLWEELNKLVAETPDPLERERYLVAGLIRMREQLIP